MNLIGQHLLYVVLTETETGTGIHTYVPIPSKTGWGVLLGFMESFRFAFSWRGERGRRRRLRVLVMSLTEADTLNREPEAVSRDTAKGPDRGACGWSVVGGGVEGLAA